MPELPPERHLLLSPRPVAPLRGRRVPCRQIRTRRTRRGAVREAAAISHR